MDGKIIGLIILIIVIIIAYYYYTLYNNSVTSSDTNDLQNAYDNAKSRLAELTRPKNNIQLGLTDLQNSQNSQQAASQLAASQLAASQLAASQLAASQLTASVNSQIAVPINSTIAASTKISSSPNYKYYVWQPLLLRGTWTASKAGVGNHPVEIGYFAFYYNNVLLQNFINTANAAGPVRSTMTGSINNYTNSQSKYTDSYSAPVIFYGFILNDAPDPIRIDSYTIKTAFMSQDSNGNVINNISSDPISWVLYGANEFPGILTTGTVMNGVYVNDQNSSYILDYSKLTIIDYQNNVNVPYTRNVEIPRIYITNNTASEKLSVNNIATWYDPSTMTPQTIRSLPEKQGNTNMDLKLVGPSNTISLVNYNSTTASLPSNSNNYNFKMLSFNSGNKSYYQSDDTALINGFICVVNFKDNGSGYDYLFSPDYGFLDYTFRKGRISLPSDYNDIDSSINGLVVINGVAVHDMENQIDTKPPRSSGAPTQSTSSTYTTYDNTNQYIILYVRFRVPHRDKNYVCINSAFGINNIQRGFNGYLGDFICFGSNHNEKNRIKMEGYLAWKYGLQSKLPLQHDYRNTPPIL
jgi:hypothetical protein